MRDVEEDGQGTPLRSISAENTERRVRFSFPVSRFTRSPSSSDRTADGKQICFECRKPGHMKRDYPVLKALKTAEELLRAKPDISKNFQKRQ